MRIMVNIAHTLSYLYHVINPFLIVISGNIAQNVQNLYLCAQLTVGINFADVQTKRLIAPANPAV